MKKLKSILCAVLIVALLVSSAGAVWRYDPAVDTARISYMHIMESGMRAYVSVTLYPGGIYGPMHYVFCGLDDYRGYIERTSGEAWLQ